MEQINISYGNCRISLLYLIYSFIYIAFLQVMISRFLLYRLINKLIFIKHQCFTTILHFLYNRFCHIVARLWPILIWNHHIVVNISN